MNSHIKRDVILYEGNERKTLEQEMIIEEPLVIRVEGEPYSVVMRTPGNEIFHVAGFCLAEGLVSHPDDFASIGFCSEDDTNVATVTLSPVRKNQVSDILERRGFVSQTSCGICGKEVIKDLQQIMVPCKDQMKISVDQAIECVNQISDHQEIYQKTRAAHAALIFNSDLKIMSSAEDVGRHNALDKAIGEVFMADKIKDAKLGVLSSRISYEMVQKAARAELTFLIGMSRPTALAVELGQSLNMTLSCVKKDRFQVYCGEDRF